MTEYLTPDEVAERYRISPQVVRKWCRTGKLKALRLGKLWRIAPYDLEAFLKEQQEIKSEPKKVDGLAAAMATRPWFALSS